MNTSTVRRLLFGGAIVMACWMASALLPAHGIVPGNLHTVLAIEPAHPREYNRGEIGVVRPRFARRYLVQAYRVFSGHPPLANAVREWPPLAARVRPPGDTGGMSPAWHWTELSRKIVGPPPPDVSWFNVNRPVPGGRYQEFENCPDDAFVTALRTLEARSAQFGASSANVRDWTLAQMAVFANCSWERLVLPDALPASAPAVLRADRAYQTAAAYFYAMQYEEAATRFRAIAADMRSPWRSHGRYLAARATIRLATVREHEVRQRDALLAGAEAALRGVLKDREASALHGSARGLLDLIAARLRPVDRLHELSQVLATSPVVTPQQWIDYILLMDRYLGDTVDYDYAAISERAAIIRNDDLNDWVLAIQGRGEPALARAITRWQETHDVVWLVAVLWKLPPDHAVAPAALAAAAAIDRQSPAYPTLSFLRARLLLARGERTEARQLLASLPRQRAPGFPPETLNLLAAARLRAAETFDEFLLNAPRIAVSNGDGLVFDDDVGITLRSHLPLDRLIEVAASPHLPARLRQRVANAALSRAIVLRRGEAGARAATLLRDLAPSLRSDLDAYLNGATATDRHRAGVLLLLRTPGMHAYARGLDDTESFDAAEPARKFDLDGFHEPNWWCGGKTELEWVHRSESALLPLLYPDGQVPSPAFLTAAERTAAQQELATLVAAGPAMGHLAAEAVMWARRAPADQRAAEALARAVGGARRSCSVPANSRLAFQTLHRLFPKSEWARRTKYWYSW